MYCQDVKDIYGLVVKDIKKSLKLQSLNIIYKNIKNENYMFSNIIHQDYKNIKQFRNKYTFMDLSVNINENIISSKSNIETIKYNLEDYIDTNILKCSNIKFFMDTKNMFLLVYIYPKKLTNIKNDYNLLIINLNYFT